jgi:F-type H+-transporting ATPase subunit b
VNINATLLGQAITFILFVLFTKRYVWPPMIKALKERQAKIADGLAAAERGHLELVRAQENISVQLKGAKDEAADLIVSAKKQADLIVDASRQQAHDEGSRIIQQAHLEVEHMVEQAREGLRKEVASIALVGAEKILERSIDEKVHHDMLEKLVEEI